MEQINGNLSQAASHLGAEDWLQALVGFRRANTVMNYLAAPFINTWNLVQAHVEKGVNATLIQGWYLEATAALGAGRCRDAWHNLNRILSLEHDVWVLAHDIDRVESLTSRARIEGEDGTQQGHCLNSVNRAPP